MKFLKSIAIIFFNFIDNYIHQKRILYFLKKNKVSLQTFIDVGAHKGSYTDFLRNNFKIKKAYLFEPQKKIFMHIKKKYKNNRNIQTYDSAVSDKNQYKKIFINKHDLTSSLTKMNTSNVYLNLKARLFGGNIYDMVTEEYNVKTLKLFEFIKQKKIKNVDLIKIDTEGHELSVLKGLGKKIKNIKIILIEFHNNKIYINYDSYKIHRYLIKNKFTLKKKIKFPFTEWEDRIYFNKN